MKKNVKKKVNKSEKLNKNTRFTIVSIICEILLISLFVAGAYASLIKYDVIPAPTFKSNKKDINIVENVNIGVGEKFNVNTGDDLSKNLLWRSIDNEIATVNNGIIEGKALGETNVTLTLKNGDTKTVYVYVNDNNIPLREGTTSQDIYVIHYNPNGGQGVNKTTTCKMNASCAISGNFFSKDGYKFIGWTTSKNSTADGYNWTGWKGTWTFKNGEKGVNNNKLVLYAMWEKDTAKQDNTYTISYNANGGSGTMTTHTCKYGEKCTIKTNEFTRSGYVFQAFATSSSGQSYNWTGWTGTWKFTNGKYGVKDNKLVLYARWKKVDTTPADKKTGEVFTIIYRANGGSILGSGTSSTYCEKQSNGLIKCTSPTKGGTVTEVKQTCKKGEQCQIGDIMFQRSGYKFTKWRTTSSTSVPGYNWTGWKGVWNFSNGQYGINNNQLILYATWTENTTSSNTNTVYTIKYNPNGASGNAVTQTCKYGEKCTIKDLSVFKRSGYKLVKWRTNSSTSVKAYNWTNWTGTWKFNNGQYGISNNTLNLYATWEKEASSEQQEKYIVSYDANGGTGSMPTTTCTPGKTCTIKNCDYSRKGYKFIGWTTNSNGNDDGYNWTGWSGTWNYKNGQYGIKNNKVVLYARWSKTSSSSKKSSNTNDITKQTKYDKYQLKASCSSSTLNYKIYYISGDYYTLIWASNPTKQLNGALATQTAQGVLGADVILRNEINNKKLTNKCMVAVNASFFSDSSPQSKVVIHDGKAVKNSGTSGAIIGINGSGKIKMYLNTTADNILSDGVRNTFVVSSPVLVDKGTDNAARTQIYQVDSNNFVLYSGSGSVSNGYTKVVKNFELSDKIKGWNLDGGGSRRLYYKTKDSSTAVGILTGGRQLPDMLYFSE